MNKTKKHLFSGLLAWAAVVLLGGCAGYLGAMLAGRMGLAGGFIAIILGIAAGLLVQIVVHEAGHLAAGLATGYGFVSFRVGSWMLIRRAGRFHLCRYDLPGTGGQCLLAPPPWREKGFPAFFYNLGGPLANLLFSALCWSGAWLGRESLPGVSAVLVGVGIAGFYLGLVNGVPMKIGGMPNDGFNALTFGKDRASGRAFWAQLAINAAQIEGKRLGEIPAGWFDLPGDTGPDDPLKGAVWVYRYGRLIDQGRYSEAEALGARLLEQGRLAGVHRYALEADQGFFRLLEGRTREGLDILNRREIKAYLKQMKGNPGTVLVQYGAALAAGRAKEAAGLRERLVKELAAWPYPGDAAAVRQQLAWSEEKLCKSVTEPGGKMWDTKLDNQYNRTREE